MTDADSSPVPTQRQHRQRQGFVRVAVEVRKEDAGLVREVAIALGDPGRAAETRALLRERIVLRSAGGLKALLASAPLEGIEIERPHDLGRGPSC